MLTKNGALVVASSIAGLAAVGSLIAAKDPETCANKDVVSFTPCSDVQIQYLTGAIVFASVAAIGLAIALAIWLRAKRNKR